MSINSKKLFVQFRVKNLVKRLSTQFLLLFAEPVVNSRFLPISVFCLLFPSYFFSAGGIYYISVSDLSLLSNLDLKSSIVGGIYSGGFFSTSEVEFFSTSSFLPVFFCFLRFFFGCIVFMFFSVISNFFLSLCRLFPN